MKLTAIKPSSNERCIDCANYVEGDICHICEFIPKQKTTNADRIRSMSDEELAHFLEMEAGRFVSFYPTPAKTWLDWLRLEAKESIRLKDLFPSLT